MSVLKLFWVTLKHLVKSGVLWHLIAGAILFHWGAQVIHLLFRSEIFGDLSLSSVIPVPTRAKLNLWMLVGSGFFSASVLGCTLIPYFFTEGRERAMCRNPRSWWSYPLVTFTISLAWFTLLFLVVSRVSHGMSDFSLKSQVSLFRLWMVWLTICVSLAFTVGWLGLLVSPGVALLLTAVGTLTLLMMSMLDRFGLWGLEGLPRFTTAFIPSGDLGFDFWKWLNGEIIPSSVVAVSCLSAIIMVGLFAVTLRYLPIIRRAKP